MTVINTNVAAHVSANAMKTNARAMENTMERLATGQRINSASDDAAGLAIGSRMTAQINGLEQATRNANDGISLLQTADGAAVEISDMLQRMRELAVQSRNSTNDTNDITNLNKEFVQLATEIDRIANDTKFNGTAILDGSGTTLKTFVVGADQDDTVTITMKDFNLAAGALTDSGETKGSGDLAATRAHLRAALATTQGVSISDGTTTISITMADIHSANTNTAILASAATQAQIALALTQKANATEAFTATFTSSSTTGLKVAEKTGQGGVDKTYTVGGSTDLTGTVTLSNGASGVGSGVYGTDISSYSATSVTVDDDNVIANLDTAIVNVAAARADFGSVINRLEHTIDNLNSSVLNTKSARSAIVDADYASETTELARTQIISQASTAMLSQANQQAQSVLALLK
jgi:flagellin